MTIEFLKLDTIGTQTVRLSARPLFIYQGALLFVPRVGDYLCFEDHDVEYQVARVQVHYLTEGLMVGEPAAINVLVREVK